MQFVSHTLSLLALLPCVLAATGCSLWNPRSSLMADYQRTQQELAPAGAPVQPAQYTEEPHTEEPPDDDGLSASDFTPENLPATVRELSGNGPDSEEAKRLFAKGQQAYQEAVRLKQQAPNGNSGPQFVEAAELFSDAAERWPDSELEQDALHMAGESYFFSDHYWDAEIKYEALLEKYPNSKYLDTVQPRRFAIAQYWLALHRQQRQAFYEMNFVDESLPFRDPFGHAMDIFDRIRLDDPTGELADDATLALGNAYFAEGKFVRADEYYTDLRKTFPSSEHQFRAHFLGLKSKLEAYQGPDYSADALDGAEKLVEQLRKQFPKQAQEEREYIDREAARVRYLKAERDWLMAQRYDQRAEYGAAKIYYRELASNYPQTPFGKRAQQRLRQIQGEPNVPEQPLSWLVAMFPEDDQVDALMDASQSNNVMRR